MESRTRREIERLVSQEGLSVAAMSQGKTHIKLRVQAPDGREDLVVCSVSPGDHRAILNTRSRLRRFAKGQPV